MPELAGRDGAAYVRARDRLRKTADPVCWICHREIDLFLDWRHPMSWTADHEVPLSKGGDILGVLHPAHRSCNSRRGNGPRLNVPPPSRDW